MMRHANDRKKVYLFKEVEVNAHSGVQQQGWQEDVEEQLCTGPFKLEHNLYGSESLFIRLMRGMRPV